MPPKSTKRYLRELESELDQRGLPADTRDRIRSAKICFVDDQLDELQGLLNGLEREGFSHIVKLTSVDSANEILNGRFDLVILDLKGIAAHQFDDDGIGVLEHLKRAAPELPVLVLSGSTTTPDQANQLSRADLIRTKPIKAGDLCNDMEDLLKRRIDEHWAGLAILNELYRIKPELAELLSPWQKVRIAYLSWRIRNRVESNGHVAKFLLQAASVLESTGSLALRIVLIAKGLPA